jgi:hypothetical protein
MGRGEGGRDGKGEQNHGGERWQVISGVLLPLAHDGHDCQQTCRSNTPAVAHETTPVPCPMPSQKAPPPCENLGAGPGPASLTQFAKSIK